MSMPLCCLFAKTKKKKFTTCDQIGLIRNYHELQSISVKIIFVLALAIKLNMLKTLKWIYCAHLISFVCFPNWYKSLVQEVLVPFSISPFDRFRTGSSQHSLEVNLSHTYFSHINFAFNIPTLPHSALLKLNKAAGWLAWTPEWWVTTMTEQNLQKHLVLFQAHEIANK